MLRCLAYGTRFLSHNTADDSAAAPVDQPLFFASPHILGMLADARRARRKAPFLNPCKYLNQKPVRKFGLGLQPLLDQAILFKLRPYVTGAYGWPPTSPTTRYSAPPARPRPCPRR